jgi:hypothetical protein
LALPEDNSAICESFKTLHKAVRAKNNADKILREPFKTLREWLRANSNTL